MSSSAVQDSLKKASGKMMSAVMIAFAPLMPCKATVKTVQADAVKITRVMIPAVTNGPTNKKEYPAVILFAGLLE